MTRHKGSKINHLLKNWPRGTVAVPPWLKERGVYRQLVGVYLQTGWLERIGNGAFKIAGDKVEWTGGLYAVQRQLGLAVHVGGKTALEMHGYAHFLPLGKGYLVYVFGVPGQKLPSWFRRHSWNVKLRHVTTNLFSAENGLGLTEKDLGTYTITISTPERAIMELLHLVPQEISFEGAQQLMEGLTTLRPALVQELLTKCHSVKVRRLFMYLSEKSNLPWVSKLDQSRLKLGKGKRSIVKGGRLDPKYQITVPA
jgi:Transcriptional regulator, AbiEi antitoxin, Type IV TA system/Transcriptional regulator, AbiEi antitoxin N-terminal domain